MSRAVDILPVYMDFANRFWIGESLRDISKYKPRPPLGQQVTFRWGDNGPVICAIDGDGRSRPVDVRPACLSWNLWRGWPYSGLF